MSDNWLEHYGTKGMKWGVRKKPGSGKGKSAGATAKTLTNKELQKRVNRLNLEKQYVTLSEGSVSKGKGMVKGMLKTAGKQKMQSVINESVSDVVDIGIKAVKAKVRSR